MFFVDSRFNTDRDSSRTLTLRGLSLFGDAVSLSLQRTRQHLVGARFAPIKTTRKLRDRIGRAGKRTKEKNGRKKGREEERTSYPWTVSSEVSRAKEYPRRSCTPALALLLSLHPLFALVLLSPSLLSFTAATACLLLYGTENCGAVDSVFPLAVPDQWNFHKRVIRG